MIICSTCGTINEDFDKFCGKCGQPLAGMGPREFTVVVGRRTGGPSGGSARASSPGSGPARAADQGTTTRERPRKPAKTGGTAGSTGPLPVKRPPDHADEPKPIPLGSTPDGLSTPVRPLTSPLRRTPVKFAGPVEKPALKPIPRFDPEAIAKTGRPVAAAVPPRAQVRPPVTQVRPGTDLTPGGGVLPIKPRGTADPAAPLPLSTVLGAPTPIVDDGSRGTGETGGSAIPPVPLPRTVEPKPATGPRATVAETTPEAPRAGDIQGMMARALQDLSKKLGEIPRPTSLPRRVARDQADLSQVQVEDLEPQTLNEILTALIQIDSYIEASCLLRRDGTILASAISRRITDTLFATIAKTLGHIGEDMIRAVDSGELQYASLHGTTGVLYLAPVLDDLLLILLTSPKSKPGVINVAVHRVRGMLRRYFGL